MTGKKKRTTAPDKSSAFRRFLAGLNTWYSAFKRKMAACWLIITSKEPPVAMASGNLKVILLSSDRPIIAAVAAAIKKALETPAARPESRSKGAFASTGTLKFTPYREKSLPGNKKIALNNSQTPQTPEPPENKQREVKSEEAREQAPKEVGRESVLVDPTKSVIAMLPLLAAMQRVEIEDADEERNKKSVRQTDSSVSLSPTRQ